MQAHPAKRRLWTAELCSAAFARDVRCRLQSRAAEHSSAVQERVRAARGRRRLRPTAQSGLRSCGTPCKYPGFRRWRLHPGYAVDTVVTPRWIGLLSDLADQDLDRPRRGRRPSLAGDPSVIAFRNTPIGPDPPSLCAGRAHQTGPDIRSRPCRLCLSPRSERPSPGTLEQSGFRVAADFRGRGRATGATHGQDHDRAAPVDCANRSGPPIRRHRCVC
jgi:hypothetical protein